MKEVKCWTCNGTGKQNDRMINGVWPKTTCRRCNGKKTTTDKKPQGTVIF